MLKLVKKHDWLELKAENLLLKEEVDRLAARLEKAKDKAAAWQEQKPYCGEHCRSCKNSYVAEVGYFGPLGIRKEPDLRCMLEDKLSCYLYNTWIDKDQGQ